MMDMRQVSTAACWVAILASFVLSFSTWLALGQLAGFGALAVALPFCVDGYLVTALTTWLWPGISASLARFARNNLYAVGVAAVLAQASYHGAITIGHASWAVALAFVVGGLPPAIATVAVHIRARAVREAEPVSDPAMAPELSLPAVDTAQLPMPAAPPQIEPTAPPESAPQLAREVAPPRPKVESSGSGQRRSSASLDDVRRWLDDGLSHRQIAQRLNVSPRTATRRIADARSEGAVSLRAVR
jgi:DNA-binding NarL/FixJ family response regulator